VTLYMRNHPELFNLVKLDAPQSRRDTSIHVAVDYPEDLELVGELCRRSSCPGDMNTEEVMELLRQDPKLLSVNAGLHEPYVE